MIKHLIRVYRRSSAALCFRQLLETLVQFLQPSQNFVPKTVLLRGNLPFQEESAAWLQNGCLDFIDIVKTLPVAYREQFGFGEQLLSQSVAPDLAVFDQDRRATL